MRAYDLLQLMTTAAVMGLLAAAIYVMIRNEFRCQIYIQRAQYERDTPWPVARYLLATSSASEGLGPLWSQEVTTTWPQVARWAAARSTAPDVGEVYVIRRDGWRGLTTWTWDGGVQIRRVPGYSVDPKCTKNLPKTQL